ncbi:hypothetical protein [Brevifollis gellanilyticus]|uniref:Uncharacterized protein n=1 Tax=Brevifollis gellanilyticus TaxID=748831 RepID=A0A512MBN0_9BACT|nr:hypothetical protein [Brevifollis gellanilyticus]GEP44142.1 hypothetical protein BGE01nite_34330 [Brevifollis gellanilyticus]
MNQSVSYSVKVRYYDKAAGDPPKKSAKLISIWGGQPDRIKDGAKPTIEMGLLLTVRNDDLGEPIDVFKYNKTAGTNDYELIFSLLPGEVRTVNLATIPTLCAAVTEVPNADSMVHCVLHQSFYKLP